MKKLITLTDYVLEQNKISLPLLTTNWNKEFETRFKNIVNYAKFLSMPLELKMFVPCDSENNVLEEPHNYGLLNTYPTGNKLMDKAFDPALEYQKAKSEVIFEGFELETDMYSQIKRSIIWMPDGINQVYRKLEFYNGDIKTFFFNEEFKNIESMIKYNLTLTHEAIQQYKF